MGHLQQHSAEALDLEGVVALLHGAGDEEQHAGDQAVGNHAEEGRVDPQRGEGGDAEHDETHVGHRREGDQPLHVGLGETAEGTVDDADDGEDADDRRPLLRSLGQDRNGDAHEAVGTEFQQDRGQNHRALGGRLGMGVGQPGVEREHRHLDREAHEHAGEDPDLGVLGQLATVLHQVRDGEALRAGLDEQGDERHQHQGRTEHRVEEELQRGVLTVLAAPHSDHEVHRQQHHFEEDEEENQVLGDEGARHADLQHEHEDEEGLGVARLGDVVPRIDHHQQGDDHGEDVEGQADPVEADRVRRLDRLDPLAGGEELEITRPVVVELDEGVDAHGQSCGGGDDADELGVGLVLLRDEEHHQHANQRQEGAEAEEPLLFLDHLRSL